MIKIRKIILILILMLILTSAANASFRDYNWGTEYAVIKESVEEDPLIDNGEEVVYLENVAGLDAFLTYHFEEGKLIKGDYIFKEEYINPEKYIRAYEDLKKKLIDLYKDPIVEKYRWAPGSDSFKETPGLSLTLGFLSIITQWETDNGTLINLRISDDNEGGALFYLEYISPDYEEQPNTNGL